LTLDGFPSPSNPDLTGCRSFHSPCFRVPSFVKHNEPLCTLLVSPDETLSLILPQGQRGTLDSPFQEGVFYLIPLAPFFLGNETRLWSLLPFSQKNKRGFPSYTVLFPKSGSDIALSPLLSQRCTSFSPETIPLSSTQGHPFHPNYRLAVFDNARVFPPPKNIHLSSNRPPSLLRKEYADVDLFLLHRARKPPSFVELSSFFLDENMGLEISSPSNPESLIMQQEVAQARFFLPDAVLGTSISFPSCRAG